MAGVFYRVYRPKKFADLVGQKTVRLTLEQSIKENRLAQAYLFTGPRGTGKTTLARIFAKSVDCLTPLSKRKNAEPCEICKNCKAIDSGQTLDLVEIDAASYTGVDNIRQITENISLSPSDLKYRIFIIDEVHMLSKGAFNALLKTLEEPPGHVIFILATTEYQKVPATITSRCQRYFFQLLTVKEIVSKLNSIVKKENIKITNDGLNLIAQSAGGGMRDAESLMFQIISLEGKNPEIKQIENILGVASQKSELTFLKNLFEKNFSLSKKQFHLILEQGVDPFLFSHRILELLRKILIIKLDPSSKRLFKEEMNPEQFSEIQKLGEKIELATLTKILMKFVQTQPIIKSCSLPYLPIEIIIAELCPLQKQDKESSSTNLKINEPSPILAEAETKNSSVIEPALKKFPEKKIENLKVSPEFENSPTTIKNQNPPIEPLVSLKNVLEKWPKILGGIKDLQPALLSILKVCSPVKIEADTLIISTPFKFHREKLNEAKNKTLFCQELKTATGIGKICVLEDSSIGTTQPNSNKDDLFDQVESLLN